MKEEKNDAAFWSLCGIPIKCNYNVNYARAVFGLSDSSRTEDNIN